MKTAKEIKEEIEKLENDDQRYCNLAIEDELLVLYNILEYAKRIEKIEAENKELKEKVDEYEDLETQASRCHQIWALWMEHFIENKVTSIDTFKCEFDTSDYDRWSEKYNMFYEELSEEEKKSDRRIARIVFEDLKKTSEI